VDWVLLGSATLLCLLGLVTMNTFSSDNVFFERQIFWIGAGLVLAISLSQVDFSFLRRTNVIVALYVVSVLVLIGIFLFGYVAKGAVSRFDFGFFSLQPSDPIKIILILLLAKYFSRRHIEIANVRHNLVSGFYVALIFVLVFLQPDFGSAIIIFFVWLGMVMVSGISMRHLALVFLLGSLAFGALWIGVFEEYQKQRILTFIHPLTDIQGAGYNAYQSTVAVGSGQISGKGIGYGTQSKLQFLPEYETDFIFAAFTEEWGFLGALIVFVLFGIVIYRILDTARRGVTNFEILFGAGLAILFVCHFAIHVGMNIGLLPVTGTTIPFMSYGGSHLIMEFGGLGILMGMRKYARAVSKEEAGRELLGPV
jgi:rod shape determining protein RodA